MILALAIVYSSFVNIPVDRVYDGDTLFITIPGVAEVLGTDLGVRISGIDTPENTDERLCMRKKAKEAKAHLKNFIDGQNVDLHFCFRDKFFRINCAVRLESGEDVGSHMLEHSWAWPYSGDKKIRRKCNEKTYADQNNS